MERAAAAKRKAPFSTLQRRVRARKDEPEDIPSDGSQVEESSEDEDSGAQSHDGDDDDEEQDRNESNPSSEDDDDEVEDPSAAASQISFGALVKAQESLPGIRRKKGRNSAESDEDDSEDDNERNDSRPESKPKAPKPHRTNKHAPTEQTSKRPVSRKREVVAVHKPVARDPRFSAAVSARATDEERARRAYGFLDEYRDSEIARVREAARKTKDPAAKEELKRALASMEGKKAAQSQRERERRVVEEHRRREKELVRQGKKPFYLKRSEQKKRLLVERFEGMKNKQVDRAIERRRKKLAAKERRDMPMARREAR